MSASHDERGLPSGLRVITAGPGMVEVAGEAIRLTRPVTSSRIYANAQIGDPGRLVRNPPLRVRLDARFSHPAAALQGTAGFGVWNAALGPGIALPRPPRAVWFFAGGAEFDVPLALDVPGNGFKAATLDAQRAVALALLPSAPLGFLVMRHPGLYRRLWPLAQRALRVAESPLPDLDITRWHTYDLHWLPHRVRLLVDGDSVLDAPGPGGPLAFVAWIDNAYAVATPRGRFSLGRVAGRETQWLEIANLRIIPE